MTTIRSARQHYDDHLGPVYEWMAGDFEAQKDFFKSLIAQNGGVSEGNAIDLGAGHGIQSIALAEAGYHVKAVDFNRQLLNALDQKKGSLPVDCIYDDIRAFRKHVTSPVDLVSCCGDTLSHLDTFAQLDRLIADGASALSPGGRMVLSFRDYSTALEGHARFIPVKSTEDRILICFLEYLPRRVNVTDILYERKDGLWRQSVSSYVKLRLTTDRVRRVVTRCGFNVTVESIIKGIVYVIGTRKTS